MTAISTARRTAGHPARAHCAAGAGLAVLVLALGAVPSAPAQSVRGVVFEDADRDGIQDVGERVFDGTTIHLFGANGTYDQVVATDSLGAYEFLPPSSAYVLGVDLPDFARVALLEQRGDPDPIPDYPRGRRRVGLLPNLVPNLRAATSVLPFVHVGLGDSIAFGFNLCDSLDGHNGYLEPYTARLDVVASSVTLDKQAVLGYETASLLDPSASGSIFTAIAQNAQLVTISIGGNDFLENDGNEAGTAANLVRARQNLQEILATLLSELPESDVLLNTVYDNEQGKSDFHDRWAPIWNQMLRDLAFGQVRPVGIAEIYPDYAHEDPVTHQILGEKDLICEFFGIDHIHPKARGYQLHREKVWQGSGGVDLQSGGSEVANFGALRRIGRREARRFEDVGGGATREKRAFQEDGVGALVPSGAGHLRLSGFDTTPRGLLSAVVVNVRYRTTAKPVDDIYRFEASVDGTFSAPGSTSSSWNTVVPLVGSAGNGVPVLARPDQPGFRTVSALVTQGAPIDGRPALTWQDLEDLTVRCVVTPVGAADAFDVEWDAAWLDLYGVPEEALLVRRETENTPQVRFDVTGPEHARTVLWASLGTASLPLPPWGTLLVDPLLAHTFASGEIGSEGSLHFEHFFEPSPVLHGRPIYFQALVVESLGASLGGLTNRAEIPHP